MGLAITVAAGAAWFFIPPSYEAFALLKVSSRPEHVLARSGGTDEEFAVFKRTQIQVLRSHFVLSGALRDPAVRRSETIRAHDDDPGDWLKTQLQVNCPDDSEILRVALKGTRPDELTKIVDAVVRAYLKEYVQRERDLRSVHERKLQDAYDNLSAQCKADEEALHKLEVAYRTSSTEAAQVKKRLEVAKLEELVARRAKIGQQITDNAMQIFLLEARQEAAEDAVKATRTSRASAAGDDTLTLPVLRRQREYLDEIFHAADADVAEQAKSLAALEGFNATVAAKLEELRKRKTIANEVGAELDRMSVERLAPERITKLDDATAVPDRSAEVQKYAVLLLAAAVGLAMIVGGALKRLPREN